MPRLYLMRHGQTVYNVRHLVQGHVDSPLTELGREQARRAARWFGEHGVAPAYLCSSPLGRARDTLDIVIEENPAFAQVPRADEPGLIERCYGSFEGTDFDSLPASPWDPGDACVPYGGDSEAEARERVVGALTHAMDRTDGDVIAVAHGSITTLFKKTWAAHARCPQDVALGNCCILVFDYDADERTFSNLEIVNHPE